MDVGTLPNVLVDIRYGTKHNLLNRDVYGGFQRALLHKIAAGKFIRASTLLHERRPELRFIVFDALRPQAAQLEFWALVKGTPQQHFFADPAKGSIHSFGFAVDLGLLSLEGAELDMGTGFDDLTDLSSPSKEVEFTASGALKPEALANRKILRGVMEDSGFLQLASEWWHFDAMAPTEVRSHFKRLE